MPKSFKYWFADEVETTFGLKKLDTITRLEDWLKAEPQLTEAMRETLLRLRLSLQRNADAWNEEELKVFFISHILDMVSFEIEYENIKLKPFLERALTFTFQKEIYKGEVDFMVASGRQLPKKPYFFVHEYKQETKKDADPLGQLLMGMLAAKFENDNDEPIYGAYIVGRSWFFVVINEHNEYSVSDAYLATQDAIFQIIGILQQAKEYIVQAVKTAK